VNKRSKQVNMEQSLKHIAEKYFRMPEDTLIKRLEMYKDAFLSEVEFDLLDELHNCNGRSHVQTKEDLKPLFNRIRKTSIYIPPVEPLNDGIINDLMKRIKESAELCDYLLNKMQAQSWENKGEKPWDRIVGHLGKPTDHLDGERKKLVRQIQAIKSNINELKLGNIVDVGQLFIVQGDQTRIKNCKGVLLSFEKKFGDWHQSHHLQAKQQRVIDSYRRFFIKALSEYEREFEIIKHKGQDEVPELKTDTENQDKSIEMFQYDHEKYMEKEFGFRQFQEVEESKSKRGDEYLTILNLLKEQSEPKQEQLLDNPLLYNNEKHNNEELESVPFYEVESIKNIRVDEDLEILDQLNLEKEQLFNRLFELGVAPEEYQKAYTKRKQP